MKNMKVYRQDELPQQKEERKKYKKVDDLQINEWILMKNDSPCRIVELRKSKTIGKVGIPKAMITGLDLIACKKYEQLTYLKNYVKMGQIEQNQYLVAGYQNQNKQELSFISLFDVDGSIKHDIKIRGDIDFHQKVKQFYDESIDKEFDLFALVAKIDKKQQIILLFKSNTKILTIQGDIYSKQKIQKKKQEKV